MNKRKKEIVFVLLLLLLVLTLHSGVLLAQQKTGDNLGTHIATRDLYMQEQSIVNVKGIVIGKAVPDNNSIALQIDGQDKAMLVSRVSDLAAIANPVDGMLLYQSTENRFYMRQNGAWESFIPFSLQPAQILVGNTNSQAGAVTMTGDVTLDLAGTAAITTAAVQTSELADGAVVSTKIGTGEVNEDDLSADAVTSSKLPDASVSGIKLAAGAAGTISIADNAVTAAKISSSTAGSDMLLTTDVNGLNTWVDKSRVLVPPLADAQIIVGNADGRPAAVNVSKDISLINTGAATITADAVTSKKIADAAIIRADLSVDLLKTRPAKIDSATAGPGKILVNNTGEKAIWDSKTIIQGFSVGDVKPYFPHLMGASPPANWVACAGQVLNDAGSPLNGKTIPNLNNNNLLVGSAGASGQVTGLANAILTPGNLPEDVSLTAASANASGGVPTGSVNVITATATHNHGMIDPGHYAPVLNNWQNIIGSGVNAFTFRGVNVTTYINSAYAPADLSIIGSGYHIHPATFTGAPLLAHAHTGFTINSLNGGVTQTGIETMPQSVRVMWIMKVK